MTKEEVIQAVKDMGLTASELFAKDELRNDDTVAAIIEEATAKERGYGSRQATKVEKLQQRLTEMAATHEAALNEVRAESMQATSRRALEAMVTERNLDESQKKFIERNWKTFETKATDEEGLRKDLGHFVEAQLKEYQTIATDVYGLKPDATGRIPSASRGRSLFGFGPGRNPLIRG